MIVDDEIVVKAGARKVRGWTSARIERGIEDMASTFELELSGYFAATGDDQLVCGDAVQVYAGADLVVTGYVEAVSDQVDAESEGTSITGRSKTCDAVDCSAALGTWAGLKLRDLFTRIVGEHGLSLVDEAGVADAIIRSHKTEPGETIHDALDRLGRELGYLLTDDAAGRVVLTRAGKAGRAVTRIVQGAGVIASSGGWNVAQRFSAYEAQGQSIGADSIDATATGDAEDPGVTRARKLIVVPERGVDKTGARRRARWEAVTRAGKSFSASYTLRGWRQTETGPLWAPNLLVNVVDGRRGLFDAELLVTSVALVANADGRKAEVTVAPAAGFEVLTTHQVSGCDLGRWFTQDSQQGTAKVAFTP